MGKDRKYTNERERFLRCFHSPQKNVPAKVFDEIDHEILHFKLTIAIAKLVP